STLPARPARMSPAPPPTCNMIRFPAMLPMSPLNSFGFTSTFWNSSSAPDIPGRLYVAHPWFRELSKP
ncbi:hypothetical protein PMAYCL1PPCAC_09556, partial [Pristionchus mayeri]